MKKIFCFIFIIIISTFSQSQQKWAAGINIGFGKNYYSNDYQTNPNHFSFESPMSILIGAQFIKFTNKNSQIVEQLSYTTKKIQLNYKTNETNLPYEVNEEVTDKYDCFSFSIGYRKPFVVRRVNHQLKSTVCAHRHAAHTLPFAIGFKNHNRFGGTRVTEP